MAALRLGACILLLLSLISCSPAYVLRAAWEQGKVLASREDIASLLKKEDLPASEREKFQLVLRAREFALSIGLKPGNAFTTYAVIPRPEAAWVVSASRKDAFGLVTWWFPIVGSVPYKGFFSPEEANEEARDLEGSGLETWVRGTEAFSTLGWFSDPLLSTTLNNHPVQIADTVLHESLHSTVWLKNRVDLNESLANFVGGEAAIQFFTAELAACRDEACRVENEKRVAIAHLLLDRSIELEQLLSGVFEKLDALYKPDLPQDQKLTGRERVFESAIEPIRAKYPTLSILKNVNNAEILQLRLYYQGTAAFVQLFKECGQQWACFLERAAATK